MNTVLKIIAAAVVVLALAAALTYVTFYLAMAALIISLFYKGAMFFIIGAIFVGFLTWIAIRIFDRHKVYNLKKGVHYEASH